MRLSRLYCALAVLTAALTASACGSDSPSGSECETNDECGASEVCTENACVSADAVSDGGIEDTGGIEDAGGEDAGGEDAGPDGDATADAGDDVGDDVGDDTDDVIEDTDVANDSENDAEVEPDGSAFPTLNDYRACDSDTDCPVGLGNCITELALNRPDPVLGSRVSIADIAPDWPSAGVCSLGCSTDPSVCATLELRDSLGRGVAFSCQVVVEGTSPYPGAAPPFPFDDTLDPADLGAGVPFGALCRPPLHLDPDRSDNFCFACDGNDTCGDGDLCWDFGAERTAELGGSCLMACDEDSPCPLGFSCDELSQDDGDEDGITVLGTYCAPVAQTCGDCRDFDGDRRGVGFCGAGDQLVSAVDCDDLNDVAYYSATNPDHAFPDMCGEFDLNCNGRSDANEQVGADVYPQDHCTACFEGCGSIEPNASRQCLTDTDSGQPFCAVVCDDPNAFADCTEEPGCETPVDDPSRLFYRDADGDGAGDPDDVVFACEAGEAPDGYVANSADCNDEQDTAFGAYGDTPAATEICDGFDNDCDGGTDVGILEVGDACASGLPGVCGDGTLVCSGEAGLECVPTIAPNTQTEVCDGLDNDCDDFADEPEDIVEIGSACVADALGVCASGSTVCQGEDGLFCEAGSPESGIDFPDDDAIDSDCDGMDGDISRSVFVSPGGLDSADGTITRPVQTLQRAVQLANNISRNHIIMDAGDYETSQTTNLGNSRNIFGGFVRGADTSWQRSSERARLVATLAASEVPAVGLAINAAAIDMVIDRLDIEVSTLGSDGQTVIGATCAQCTRVSFSNVDILAGPGAPGIDGTTGEAGVNGFAGNPGGLPPPFGSMTAEDPCHGTPQDFDELGGGGAGMQAIVPTPSGAGMRGAGNASLAGSGGTSVGAGSVGRAGGDATEVTAQPSAANGGANTGTPDPSAGSYNSGIGWVRPNGSDGLSGFSGAGGGGGSGGGHARVDSSQPYLFVGLGGASGGTAGCRGEGGTRGEAGGSSIALVLDRSNGVAFDNVSLTSSAGGAGGRGGQGGLGGNGGDGGPSESQELLRRGGVGGAASGGGGGGGGGGGAGGSSFAVLRDSTTAVGGGVSFSTGAAGAGGAGGPGGLGGQHGDLVDGEPSVNGPNGRDGANGESVQQRVY